MACSCGLLAPAPTLLSLLVSVADHAAFNGHATLLWPQKPGEGFPLLLQVIWTLDGNGRLAIPLNLALLILCLAVDASRRVRVAGVPVAPLGRGARGVMGAAASALGSAAVYTVQDVATILKSFVHRPGATRQQDIERGRRAGRGVLEARRLAMAHTTPGTEPSGRRVFRILCGSIATLILVLLLNWGGTVACEIGRTLSLAGDQPFFAGLLDSLASWWGSLGPTGQILATGLAIGLIPAFGGSLLLALGTTGVATWALDHGTGLADLARDPAVAVRGYFMHATPGSILADTLDFALTFVPGAILGKALKGPLAWLARGAPEQARLLIKAWQAGRVSATVPGRWVASILERVTPTQAPRAVGSVIPTSFTVRLVDGSDVWVHANATKHLAEETSGLTFSRKIAEQERLAGLLDAIEHAEVARWEQVQVVNDWELIFSPPRTQGLSPVLKHARWLGGS